MINKPGNNLATDDRNNHLNPARPGTNNRLGNKRPFKFGPNQNKLFDPADFNGMNKNGPNRGRPGIKQCYKNCDKLYKNQGHNKNFGNKLPDQMKYDELFNASLTGKGQNPFLGSDGNRLKNGKFGNQNPVSNPNSKNKGGFNQGKNKGKFDSKNFGNDDEYDDDEDEYDDDENEYEEDEEYSDDGTSMKFNANGKSKNKNFKNKGENKNSSTTHLNNQLTNQVNNSKLSGNQFNPNDIFGKVKFPGSKGNKFLGAGHDFGDDFSDSDPSNVKLNDPLKHPTNKKPFLYDHKDVNLEKTLAQSPYLLINLPFLNQTTNLFNKGHKDLSTTNKIVTNFVANDVLVTLLINYKILFRKMNHTISLGV